MRFRFANSKTHVHVITLRCVIFLIAAVVSAAAGVGNAKVRPLNVRHVTLNGNASFATDLLFDRMITRPVWLWNRVVYSPLVLEDDIGVLNSFYRNQGFLDVRIRLDSAVTDSLRRVVDIWISIEENSRTVIEDIVFLNNGRFSDSMLAGVIRSKKGKPLITTQVDDDTRAILRLLTANGLLYASVDHSVAFPAGPDRAVVTITCSEGRTVRTGQTVIFGLENVKKELVLKTITLREGDTLSSTTIYESNRRLYGSGLFSRVDIIPNLNDSIVHAGESDSGSVVRSVAVKVVETPMYQIEGGIGYGSYEILRGSAGISYKNLFGIGKRISAGGNLSLRRQRGEIGYSDPTLFWSPVAFDLNAYYGHHDEVNYAADIGGFKSGLGLATRNRNLYRLMFRWESVGNLVVKTAGGLTVKDKAYDSVVNLQSAQTQSISGSVTFDRRDDFMNPSKGAYLDLKLEIAGLGGTSRFYKGVVDGNVYLSWRGLVFASGMTAGLVHQYGNSIDVIPTERFTLGNTGTVRGFSESRPTADGAMEGGRLLIIIHPLECRFPIYKALGGAFFADGANVWYDEYQFDIRRFCWSVGTGVRFNLPLGVLRLDLGFGLTGYPDASDPPVVIQFDIGQAF